ncbi:tumor necrosis factor receptor superfamily member 3-like [Heptranchias perlo]|uniref:tumor necrosis factor receptor superfamily member 3-like n=1 Tax=Heptranchias perlo TaxID=212740 RepID=UPI0035594CE4
MGPWGQRDVLVALISLLCHTKLVNSGPSAPRGRPCFAETEYYENDLRQCCRKCSPGHYAYRRCTQSQDTDCRPCPPGEFTEFWNYILECKLCPACDQRRGLVVQENCSSTVKTKCQCVSGMHCVDVRDCTDCELHRSCPPGAEISRAGTPTHDTTCVPCPPGTFQKVESLERCQRHKNCSAHRLVEAREGTANSDAICKDPEPARAGGVSYPPAVWRPTQHLDPAPDNSYLLIAAVTMAFLFLCALLGGIAAYVWNRRRNGGELPLAESAQRGSEGHSSRPPCASSLPERSDLVLLFPQNPAN